MSDGEEICFVGSVWGSNEKLKKARPTISALQHANNRPLKCILKDVNKEHSQEDVTGAEMKYLGEKKASAERGERGVGWKVLRPEGGWNTNPWGANETGVTLATSTIFSSFGGEGLTAAATLSAT